MYLKIRKLMNGNHFMHTIILTRVRDPDEMIHITFPSTNRSIKQFTSQEKRIFKRKTPFSVVRLYGNHWVVLCGIYEGNLPKTCRNLRNVNIDMKNMEGKILRILSNHSQYLTHSKRETLWKRYYALHDLIKRHLKKIT